VKGSVGFYPDVFTQTRVHTRAIKKSTGGHNGDDYHRPGDKNHFPPNFF
jgi:hypothetical protein